MAGKIQPVILSGGSGSRLWPLSREAFPKQLLPLTGERTLLQQAALRVADPRRFEPLLVVANADHRFIVAEQLRAAGTPEPTVVLEPVGRNTAAAVAVAAVLTARRDPQALLLVMPADHHVGEVDRFLAAIERGAEAARAGALVLFGMTPDRPATGYGYIQAGETIAPGVARVSRFVEKPDRAAAEGYLAQGGYAWNSGIFLMSASTILAELAARQPEILASATAAVDGAQADLDFLRLDGEAFHRAPSLSLDHAVMEHTSVAAVVAADFGWADVGSWSALLELAELDEAGNARTGDVLLHGARGCYIRSEGQLVAAIGVEDLIVVATPDAVLVAARAADQEVKAVVERLKRSNHRTATRNRRTYRPWGWYEELHDGERFQVKRITVKPGGKLSLQKHFHRAEHWVVVNGTAEVQVDGEARLLSENESLYIPLGSSHRLSNPGKVALNLIEVQSGAYLGEDDIVRLEDIYARA